MDVKSGVYDALIVDIGRANYHLKKNKNNRTFKMPDDIPVTENMVKIQKKVMKALEIR